MMSLSGREETVHEQQISVEKKRAVEKMQSFFLLYLPSPWAWCTNRVIVWPRSWWCQCSSQMRERITHSRDMEEVESVQRGQPNGQTIHTNITNTATSATWLTSATHRATWASCPSGEHYTHYTDISAKWEEKSKAENKTDWKEEECCRRKTTDWRRHQDFSEEERMLRGRRRSQYCSRADCVLFASLGRRSRLGWPNAARHTTYGGNQSPHKRKKWLQ